MLSACGRSVPQTDSHFHAELYVAGGSEVRVFDASTLGVVSRIPLSSPANALVYDAHWKLVYAAENGRLELIDPAAHAITRTFRLPGAAAAVVAGITADEGELLLLEHAPTGKPDSVAAFDPSTGIQKHEVQVGHGCRAMRIAGQRLIVAAHDDNVINLVDTRTWGPPLAIRVAPAPIDVLVLPNHRKAFVLTESQRLSVIDLETNSLLTDLLIGRQSKAMSLKPDTGELYVANAGSASISIIDTTANQVSSTLLAGKGPFALLAYQAANVNLLYVANSESNTVSLINVDDRKTLTSVPVGVTPQALLLGPFGRTLFVEDAGSNDIAVLSTVSPEAPALIALLPAPPNAGAMALVTYSVASSR
jgi:YVTN family beta-propeller protein